MATVFLGLIFISYITLGLPDAATGTAWPFMRPEFGVPLAAGGLFAAAVTVCSAISASVVPRITRRTGTGIVIAVCSLVTGASILGASFAKSFYVVLALAVPLGFAGGGVDVSINNYIAERYSSRIMNWVHASWGLGAMIGPLIITLALNVWGSWRSGFMMLGGVQIAFAATLFLTLPMWKKNYAPIIEMPPAVDSGEAVGKRVLAIFLSVAVFFFYCGLESGVGYWLNTLLVEGRGYSETLGGTCVSVYYGMIMAGRIAMGAFANRLGNRPTMRVGLITGALGVGLFFIPGSVPATYIAVALIGFGISSIYPCMMHETNRRFDPDTAKKVIGYQVSAACVGILVAQTALGLLLQETSPETLPAAAAALTVLMAVCILSLDFITKKRKTA